MRTARQIAEELLGSPISQEGYALCPGAHLHTTPTGPHDFRLWLDGDNATKPREYCFHASCAVARDEFMRRLYVALARERRGNDNARRNNSPIQRQYIAPPPLRKRPELNLARAQELAAKCPVSIDNEWLRAHSPVTIPPAREQWAELLLDTLYYPGERLLIFTRFESQGQYIRVCGRGNYQLGTRPGIRAHAVSHLPTEGAEGAWFLAAPCRGDWQPNPNSRNAYGTPKMGRRHTACCLRYPYAVLESDVLPPATWLRILAQLRDPISAVYTSGGKSIHALVSISAATPEQFNAARSRLILRLAGVGADPAAITAVRLTRLPGVLRLNKRDNEGRPGLQELLYLNPHARQGVRLLDMPQK